VVISHAHPFDKNKDDPWQNPVNTHRHSEKELMLLSLFTGYIFVFFIILSVKPYLSNYPILLAVKSNIQEIVQTCFQVHHYHAPPITA